VNRFHHLQNRLVIRLVSEFFQESILTDSIDFLFDIFRRQQSRRTVQNPVTVSRTGNGTENVVATFEQNVFHQLFVREIRREKHIFHDCKHLVRR